MTAPEDRVDPLDRALRELELELGTHVGLAEPKTPKHIRWETVYEWCKRHPGVPWEAETVYSNAIYRLRLRYPDLTVSGRDYRAEMETGRRVATMRVVYNPPKT